jgi:hypothetical protein
MMQYAVCRKYIFLIINMMFAGYSLCIKFKSAKEGIYLSETNPTAENGWIT